MRVKIDPRSGDGAGNRVYAARRPFEGQDLGPVLRMVRRRLHRLGQRSAPFVFPALFLYLQDVFAKKVPGLMASKLSPRLHLALFDPNIEGRPRNIQQAASFLSADDVFGSHDGYFN